MFMTDNRASRRRFLVATITFSGFAATALPVEILRSSAAWAAGAGEGDTGDLADLATLARTLFPYEALPDSVYTEVIDAVLTMTAADPASRNLLQSVEDQLDPSVELGEHATCRVRRWLPRPTP